MAHSRKNVAGRANRIILLVAVLAIACGAVGSTLKVFAEGSSGTGSGATGGSCAKDKTATIWWDTCYGATWRKYPAESDSITIKGTGNVGGGTIKDCKSNGGWYYRLALEQYSPKIYNEASDYVAASLGKQVGLARVNQMKNKGGYYNFIVGIPDTFSMEEVEKNFNAAKAAGITGFSTTWEQTAWFCWDPDLVAGAKFQSKSQVSGEGGTSTSPSWDADAPDLEVQADEDGKATVVFSHQLRYEAGVASGEYEEAYTTWTIKTDTRSDESEKWSTPGKESKETEWFTAGNNELKVEVTMGEGETEKKVCSTISYTTKNLNWDTSNPHKMQPAGDSGSTKACAVIRKTEVPVESTGGIVFWPQSSVASVADKDVVAHEEWTTDDKDKADNDRVSMQLSTDYDTAMASFNHKIHVEVDMGEYTFGENDTWIGSTMCTKYKVKYANGDISEEGEFCAPSPTSGSSTTSGVKDVPGKQRFVINVPDKAEEVISYNPKVISIKRREDRYDCPTEDDPDATCSYNPQRWIYYGGDGSGSGQSSADIEYFSPNEPDGSNGPSSEGDADGGPMYAGEVAEMTWWAKAEAIDTRRIVEFQSVAFEVLWSFPRNGMENAVSGDLDEGLKYSDNPGRSQSDPCSYWRNNFGRQLRANSADCTQVDPSSDWLNRVYSDGYVGRHTVVSSITRPMLIPDYVGDKYCNSFGYKWQYYWGLKRASDGNQWVYQPDNQTYWTHYDAACRTIAKKPSTAIWNGGIFTDGGIDTSLASRYDNPTVGTIDYTRWPDYSFGSWSEHLGAAKSGSIERFGTGSSLALGSTSIGVSVDSNSPLTIRNDFWLGASFIPTNPTLLSRFYNYIGVHSDLIEPGYDGSGTVTISSNYETSGEFKDIYQLSQKIIYIPRATEVKIASNVTRIDAWIVAPNATIDTCSDFNEGDTETRPADSHPCDTPLQINGPVIAKALKLNRTGGADITHDGDNYTAVFGPTYIDDWQKYTPAEVFNLSADTYLWAYAQSGRYGSSYTEAYSRELPPRY